jgi:ribonuclease HI
MVSFEGLPMADTGLLTIHTDGASRGNPGAAAFAYIIAQDGQATIEEAGCLGEMTNNQAEYTALVRALEHALQLGREHRLLIHSDSELMVKQMNGEYRVKNEELRSIYEQARSLVRRFTARVTFRHVRRGLNIRADQLCNEALDGLRLATPRANDLAPRPAAARPSLRDEALACLQKAQRIWSAGQELSPDEVWKELSAVLRRSGVRLPAS